MAPRPPGVNSGRSKISLSLSESILSAVRQINHKLHVCIVPYTPTIPLIRSSYSSIEFTVDSVALELQNLFYKFVISATSINSAGFANSMLKYMATTIVNDLLDRNIPVLLFKNRVSDPEITLYIKPPSIYIDRDISRDCYKLYCELHTGAVITTNDLTIIPNKLKAMLEIESYGYFSTQIKLSDILKKLEK